MGMDVGNKLGAIFISYRRSDSIAEAGRIYDKLAESFGAERIFKDVDNIPLGADFVEYLDQAVAQCDVLIPLIGKTWLTVTDAQGHRRLDDPNDFVRIEIASALKRDILVLPILLDGAIMPGFNDLPDDLKPLARRNAAMARHDPDFHSDMQRIIAKLKEYFVNRGLLASDTNPVLAVRQKAIAPTPSDPPQPHPTQARSKALGIPVVAILSGISGLIAITYSFQAGEAPHLLVGLLLLIATILLMGWKLSAWRLALATHALALIGFAHELIILIQEMSDVEPDGELYIPNSGDFSELAQVGSIAILALITLIILLRPRVRRNFS